MDFFEVAVVWEKLGNVPFVPELRCNRDLADYFQPRRKTIPAP